MCVCVCVCVFSSTLQAANQFFQNERSSFLSLARSLETLMRMNGTHPPVTIPAPAPLPTMYPLVKAVDNNIYEWVVTYPLALFPSDSKIATGLKQLR